MTRKIFLVAMAFSLLSGCSSFSSQKANSGTSDASTRADYDQTGGRVETAIWSNDPKKKTLPKAIGESL